MKDCGAYYKITKIWFIVADIIILGILTVLCVIVFRSNEGFATALLLSSIFVLFIFVLEFFLLRYYRNIVISVGFTDECVIIRTNKTEYTLSKKYFTLVKEETSNALTYIFYNDGTQKKKFVYIMRYAFKTHHLNISEMKMQMPYTRFE